VNTRLALLCLAATLACGGGQDRVLSEHGFIGVEMPDPLVTPDLTFTDSHGRPMHLPSATVGKVTLLMVGYTHCPDVCPVHLANLAAVLKKMPTEVQSGVQVLFVTVDPVRDTPAVLDAFVSAFDPAFLGLTGSDSTLAALQRALLLGEAYELPAKEAGTYTVGHASAVIAFTADGLARVRYPFGTRQADWAHDLPLLVAFGQR
jgi:protein SCO1/2